MFVMWDLRVCVCVFVCSCSIVAVFYQCIIVVHNRMLLSAHSNINMITNAINSAVAYIHASGRVCTKAEDMPNIITNQVTLLKTIINNAPCDTGDATSAMVALGDASFGHEHRDDLVARIHAKNEIR